jgi:hypothetical protein
MPRRQDWANLQNQLASQGFIGRESVRDVSREEHISDTLRDAIRVAQGATGSVTEHVRFDYIGHLGGLAGVLGSRFCGVPEGGGSIGPLTFGSPGGRWSRGNLRYSVNLAGGRFQPANGNPLSVIANAFSQWQVASSFFVFSQVPVGTGEDIRVVFDSGTLDNRFGRPGGVLASAGYPEQGNLQFDASEAWSTTGPAANAADLLAVALHEIGHLLGLSHSNVPGSTMYPYATRATTLDAEARDAIATLYGWRPQERLGDRATSDRASLGVTSMSNLTSRSETPHMVWKGFGGDSSIYESEFRGNWSPQQRISGIGSSESPSLTEIGVPGATPATGLLMAWKGVPGDQGLYWSRNTGSGWEPQQRIAGVGSSSRPALATVNGQVAMAWKGVGGDQGIYWSRFDGGSQWSAQALVRGVGTSDSPALAAQGAVLHMFWKGVTGDANAFHSSFDTANDPIWKPQRRIEYFDYQTGGGVPVAIGTTGGLTATLRGNRILLAWKGVVGDSGIYFSLLQNGEFSGQIRVAGIGTAVGPSLVQATGQAFMAWRGIDNDSNIYWSRLG